MSGDRFLRKVFGNHPFEWEIRHGSKRLRKGNWNIAEPVHCQDLYPSFEGTRLLRAGDIQFPLRCCVCYGEASCRLPMSTPTFLERLVDGQRSLKGLEVPHCALHGNLSRARFALLIRYFNSPMCAIACYGLNTRFLEEFCRPFSVGDLVPPWQFSPQSYAEFGWNQGVQEAWKCDAWMPFWSRLSVSDKVRYLERWNAPPDYRRELLSSDSP